MVLKGDALELLSEIGKVGEGDTADGRELRDEALSSRVLRELAASEVR